MSTKGLTVDVPPGGYDRAAAVTAVRKAGLPQVVGKLSRGPFGTSSRAMAALEGEGVPTFCTPVTWAEVHAGIQPGEEHLTEAFFGARGEVVLDAVTGRHAGS